jgi:hypothetical protein
MKPTPKLLFSAPCLAIAGVASSTGRASRSKFLSVVVTVFLLAGSTCFAAFLDITTLTPGAAGIGSFTGSLGGVVVTGTLVSGVGTLFNPVGPGIGGSSIAGDSPQWSYGTIYTPTTPLGDRVGFSKLAGGGTALVTLSFASPMTDLVFHVANLDWSTLEFGPSIADGLTGLTLLSGNGGAGDGFAVSGTTILDLAPATADPTIPFSPPPTTGPRSAYGSVLLSGTYSSLDFLMFTGPATDDANFTLSSVPEPGITTLIAMGAAGMLLCRRRQIE